MNIKIFIIFVRIVEKEIFFSFSVFHNYSYHFYAYRYTSDLTLRSISSTNILSHDTDLLFYNPFALIYKKGYRGVIKQYYLHPQLQLWMCKVFSKDHSPFQGRSWCSTVKEKSCTLYYTITQCFLLINSIFKFLAVFFPFYTVSNYKNHV